MRSLIIALSIAVSAWAANDGAKEKPAITQPIAEIKLTNGAVFRNVTIVRYERDRVVLESSGGTGPITYGYIPEPLRTQMFAERDAQLATPKPAAVPTSSSAEKSPRVCEGQAFIVTRGAGNYILGDMTVYAFPMAVWSEADSQYGGETMRLGKPLSRVKTDAEGKFKLQLPSEEEFFIFAQGGRLAGSQSEFYQWTVKSSDLKDRSNVLLTNSNLRDQRKTAKIDDEL